MAKAGISGWLVPAAGVKISREGEDSLCPANRSSFGCRRSSPGRTSGIQFGPGRATRPITVFGLLKQDSIATSRTLRHFQTVFSDQDRTLIAVAASFGYGKGSRVRLSPGWPGEKARRGCDDLGPIPPFLHHRCAAERPIDLADGARSAQIASRSADDSGVGPKATSPAPGETPPKASTPRRSGGPPHSKPGCRWRRSRRHLLSLLHPGRW